MTLSATLTERFEALYNMGVQPSALDAAHSLLERCPEYISDPFVGTDTEYSSVDIIWEDIGIYCNVHVDGDPSMASAYKVHTSVHFAYDGIPSEEWHSDDTDPDLVCIFIMSCIDTAFHHINPYTNVL